MKGQSSMEFLAYVSFTMFMLAALYGVIADKQTETFENQVQDEAKNIADKVGFNLEMALVQGEGYSRVISLPQNVAGQEYSVLATDGLIQIKWAMDSTVENTRYKGRNISFNSSGSNVFRIKNNETGVFMVEQ